MDETALRELLDSALTREPPMGPVARNSLQAGIKIRRRRRALGAAGSAIAVAVVAVAVPAVTGALGHTSAVPRTGILPAPIVYVTGGVKTGTVTAISTATNKPGKPIKVGTTPSAIGITPDGKTAYIANQVSGTVTPITAAVNKPGKPIQVGDAPDAIAITPDGKTAYVVSYYPHTVTPISTATNTAGKPIKVGRKPGVIAITP